jgi:hypothetical protein
MRTVAAFALVVLAGCASLSEDARLSAVERAVKERTGADTKWTRSEDDAGTVRGRVEELLAKPLGPAEAVQIALLNNAGLQASYAEVGIAEADLVQASRWRGPTFSFARLRRGDETEIERGVFFDVLGLLTIPFSTRASESRLQAARTAPPERRFAWRWTRARRGSRPSPRGRWRSTWPRSGNPRRPAPSWRAAWSRSAIFRS